MPVVTDQGFQPDEWARLEEGAPLAPYAIVAAGRVKELRAASAPRPLGVELAPDANVTEIAAYFDVIDLISTPFGGFGDGRGFSLARRLRDAGFQGRIRASGEVIPDQYAYARAAGFDEVAISEVRAQRQPEADWLTDAARPGWYQRNLVNGSAGR